MQERSEVQSFDFRTLRLVEEQFPFLPTYYLTSNPALLKFQTNTRSSLVKGKSHLPNVPVVRAVDSVPTVAPGPATETDKEAGMNGGRVALIARLVRCCCDSSIDNETQREVRTAHSIAGQGRPSVRTRYPDAT